MWENPETHRKELSLAVGSSNFGVDYFHIYAQHGDVFLLCTDGLHGAGTQKVKDTLTKCSEGKLTSHRTAGKLIRLANAAGGFDNTTAIVVKVLERRKKQASAI